MFIIIDNSKSTIGKTEWPLAKKEGIYLMMQNSDFKNISFNDVPLWSCPTAGQLYSSIRYRPVFGFDGQTGNGPISIYNWESYSLDISANSALSSRFWSLVTCLDQSNTAYMYM